MKLRDETPSFDFGAEPTPCGIGPAVPTPAAVLASPEIDWVEVPQALFLSWSEPMQLAYCAARDEDAAIGGHEPLAFFLSRGEHYRQASRAA